MIDMMYAKTKDTPKLVVDLWKAHVRRNEY